MAQQPQNRDVEIDFVFPLEGIDETRSFTRQKPNTTPDSRNVRSFEATTNRARGSMRPGLKKQSAAPAVTIAGVNQPIQCLDHLVSTTIPPATDFGRFLYAQAASSGFGIANGASGASVFSGLGSVSGYQFANGCFDSSGTAYVAEVNQTTGGVTIYAVDSTGAVLWSNSQLACATGANRNVPGVAVIGSYVFVGLTTTSPPVSSTAGSCRIARLLKATGAIPTGDNAWRLSSTSFNLQFSTAAQNCFCGLGSTLVLESIITGTGAIILALDSTSAAGTSYIGYSVHAGTPANSKNRIVSDGTNFYVIASVTTSQVQKYTSALVLAWATTNGDTPNDLTFDQVSNQLLVLTGAAPFIRSLNLATGAILSVADVSSSQAWDVIDCDGKGDVVVWKNSSATNNVKGIIAGNNAAFTAPTLGSVWGPSALSNAVHTGAVVNKGTAAAVSGARSIRPIAVAGGQAVLYSSTGPTTLAGGQSFSATAPQIFSAQNGLNLFFTDGNGYFYYNAAFNRISAWTATSGGTMPMDSPTPTAAKYICTWNGRTVLYGFRQNPQLWFMSAQFDPFNFNYAPSTIGLVTAATNGNISKAGLVGDFINCWIPYSDDTSVILCDHTIWTLKGDPLNGGRFDNVSQSIGGIPGNSYAIDPFGQIYFYAPVGGVFKMTPGALPVRVSQQIERRLDNIDLSANAVSLAWDIQLQGLAIWVTPYDSRKDGTNFFFEERTASWTQDFYGNKGHQPFAVDVFDGDLPEDRKIVVGGRDGFIRIMANDATTDDGTPIDSYVWLGPISTKQMDDILMKELQATLGINSGNLKYEVYVGRTVEEAIASSPAVSGTWFAGRNKVSLVNRCGFAIFLKLSATTPFAIERIRAKYQPQGAVRRIL